MTRGHRIWEGSANDAALLARLHAPVFPDAWPEEAFRSVLAREHVFVLLGAGEGAGDAEGFILIQTTAGEAEILTFCIGAAARRRGLGGALLQAAFEAAAARGADEVFLEVGEANAAALALYHRAGFVAVGRRSAYYRHGEQATDALVMRKPLKQR